MLNKNIEYYMFGALMGDSQLFPARYCELSKDSLDTFADNDEDEDAVCLTFNPYHQYNCKFEVDRDSLKSALGVYFYYKPTNNWRKMHHMKKIRRAGRKYKYGRLSRECN